MSRLDHGSNTEDDAGRYERAHAPEVSRLERAEAEGYDPYDRGLGDPA